MTTLYYVIIKREGDITMLKRLTTSLTNPPQLVFFMKDSMKRVSLYLILLPLILIVPSIIMAFIQPQMSVVQFNQLEDVLKRDFNLEGESIVDGVFATTISQTTTYDIFQISTTRASLNPYSMTFLFDSESLVLYVGTIPYESRTYGELGIQNYTFDFADQANLNTLATAISILYNTQRLSIFVTIAANYLIGLADFLLVVLLLAMMDYFLIPKQPFSFNMRFKLSVYASSIYIFLELIFILLNLSELTFISIVITYFYHIWIYRSITNLSKGVNINGPTK